MSYIRLDNPPSSGGSVIADPVEFTVDGAGPYDPASGQPAYNNPALGGLTGKYSFFLSGQYQDTNTWQKTATGMVLLFGQNFQPGQTGSFLFY